MMQLQSYAQGKWVSGSGEGTVLRDATTGTVVAHASAQGLDYSGMLDYARRVGGPPLRALTFHERAGLLKALAKYLTERKDEF
jgi:oxepin-CoA hydrolase/3-oxo-5,6-dehydrosuberyl-CoA semialdehyde dehydrogenase